MLNAVVSEQKQVYSAEAEAEIFFISGRTLAGAHAGRNPLDFDICSVEDARVPRSHTKNILVLQHDDGGIPETRSMLPP